MTEPGGQQLLRVLRAQDERDRTVRRHHGVLYDPACQDLAEHFLQHEPLTGQTMALHMERVRSLSQAIQVAVEDWCADCPYPTVSDQGSR